MIGIVATVGTAMNDCLALGICFEIINYLGRYNTGRGQMFIFLHIIYCVGTLIIAVSITIFGIV